jgi:hypothetical protein
LNRRTNLRIFKKNNVQTQGGPTETTEEFYLRNAMGQELGIVDLTKDGWHWYSSGRTATNAN